jgi:hypothetical protein
LPSSLKPAIRRITDPLKTRIDYRGERQCQEKTYPAQLYPLHTQNKRMKVGNLRFGLAAKLYEKYHSLLSINQHLQHRHPSIDLNCWRRKFLMLLNFPPGSIKYVKQIRCTVAEKLNRQHSVPQKSCHQPRLMNTFFVVYFMTRKGRIIE